MKDLLEPGSEMIHREKPLLTRIIEHTVLTGIAGLVVSFFIIIWGWVNTNRNNVDVLLEKVDRSEQVVSSSFARSELERSLLRTNQIEIFKQLSVIDFQLGQINSNIHELEDHALDHAFMMVPQPNAIPAAPQQQIPIDIPTNIYDNSINVQQYELSNELFEKFQEKEEDYKKKLAPQTKK